MDKELVKKWVHDVAKSRIVVRPDDGSYIDGVGVYVKTVFREAGNVKNYDPIIQNYSGLTKDDIRACLKFVALRANKNI